MKVHELLISIFGELAKLNGALKFTNGELLPDETVAREASTNLARLSTELTRAMGKELGVELTEPSVGR